MQYQLFVQSHSQQKFIASVVGMPIVSGEGLTENEAIAHATASLKSQLARGKFVNIKIENTYQAESQANDPWLKHLGLFSNDPTFSDEVAIYRQAVNHEQS